jgi:hypothetical protein
MIIWWPYTMQAMALEHNTYEQLDKLLDSEEPLPAGVTIKQIVVARDKLRDKVAEDKLKEERARRIRAEDERDSMRCVIHTMLLLEERHVLTRAFASCSEQAMCLIL